MMVAGQPTVNYTWDNANRLTQITQGSNTVGFVYDAANRRTTLTLPNGVTVAYTYDNDSRVSGITYTAGGTQLGNLSYSYNADGRRTAVGGSLAAVNLPAAVSGNTFNADNGMTGFDGTTLSGACPEWSRRNASGNLTSDGTKTYTWDAHHHLTAISGAATASFVYDALGRRMSKTVNGVTTQFLYDELNPVQELNASNGVTANLLTGLGIDQYFTRTDSSGTMAFLRDALGSTIGLVNSAGSIDTSYTGACPERSRREPFGNTTVSGSSANAFQFTGRENDGTGLYYYRARYYSPTFQRFIAQDPIGFAGGSPNLYGYALSSPTNLTDPLGLSSSTISVAVGIGAGVTWGTNPDGSPFWSVSLDVGAGGGYTYRPNGTSPGYSGDWTGQLVPPSLQFDQEACRAPGSHLTIGPQTNLGVSGGPLSIDTNTELGIDLGRCPEVC